MNKYHRKLSNITPQKMNPNNVTLLVKQILKQKKFKRLDIQRSMKKESQNQ